MTLKLILELLNCILGLINTVVTAIQKFREIK